MDDQNNKNLILAMVLSMLVIMVWMVLFPPPEPVADPESRRSRSTARRRCRPWCRAPKLHADPTAVEALPEAPRLRIDTPELDGSISLRGGRFDDLRLKTYRETLRRIARGHAAVTRGHGDAYYALFGWAPARA